MRHQQYIVKIPINTLREALNISDDIRSIMPAGHQNEKDSLIFIVESEKPLRTLKDTMVATTTLDEITAKKKPGRPPKAKKEDV